MTRRCLICANINPCRDHSEAEQMEELRRNDADIAAIRAGTYPKPPASPLPDLPETCPPAVHAALVAYFVGVGAHTTTRASDQRVSIMGITPKCIVAPDELWAIMRTVLITYLNDCTQRLVS